MADLLRNLLVASKGDAFVQIGNLPPIRIRKPPISPEELASRMGDSAWAIDRLVDDLGQERSHILSTLQSCPLFTQCEFSGCWMATSFPMQLYRVFRLEREHRRLEEELNKAKAALDATVEWMKSR